MITNNEKSILELKDKVEDLMNSLDAAQKEKAIL